MDQVSFTQMNDGTKEDYELLNEKAIEDAKHTADRLVRALAELDNKLAGYQITRFGHSLQSATRALRDGADTDWVVAALTHGIGNIFAPRNHDEYAATILRPFVREVVDREAYALGVVRPGLRVPLVQPEIAKQRFA